MSDQNKSAPKAGASSAQGYYTTPVSVSHGDGKPVIVWAYEAPAKHTHRTSDWSFLDNDVNDETVLECSLCGLTWHCGLPVDHDWHDISDLKQAATRFLRDELLGKQSRRQLVLPLVVDETTVRSRQKRGYQKRVTVNRAAQMALWPVAA